VINDEDFQDSASINDTVAVARFINDLARTANSPFIDGFTQCTCKHELYLLKCLIEDLYKDLPDFPQQEKEWEQKRLMEILKK
jgi:hypothetical protein